MLTIFDFGGDGCRFLIGDSLQCGRRQRARSSYCPAHHALCYLEPGSPAYAARLREEERDINFNFAMTKPVRVN